LTSIAMGCEGPPAMLDVVPWSGMWSRRLFS
jgi:hypothetical protein